MAEHPITPPPHLMIQWDNEAREEVRYHANECSFDRESLKLIKAARWGADRELEACIDWMKQRYGDESPAMGLLRKHRRPMMPSLMERALSGDAAAARQFLHEAGFTDADGQWLPQYQSPD